MTDTRASPASGRVIGRYALYDKIASGGMATIHIACTLGAVGFSRVVVVKRLHLQLATERAFVGMFVDEARLASRVRHPNVIPTLDVVAENGELFLVMDYVPGESLARLVARAAELGVDVPMSIVSAVGTGLLEGLHAAHEATSERGEPLELVHRDVSPQNVLVGVDGITRVFDFGIAKASVRIHETEHGKLQGKVAYMSPEQITGKTVDRRTDVWAAGVVLWEMATRRRLFVGSQVADYGDAILKSAVPPPSLYASCSEGFDRVIAKALERDPAKRFATARELATALEEVAPPAGMRAVGDWVQSLAARSLEQRAALVKRAEEATNDPDNARRLLAALELPANDDADAGEDRSPSSSNLATVVNPTSLFVDASRTLAGTEMEARTSTERLPPPPASARAMDEPRPPKKHGRRMWATILALPILMGGVGAAWVLSRSKHGEVGGSVVAPAGSPPALAPPSPASALPAIAPSAVESVPIDASSPAASAPPAASTARRPPAPAPLPNNGRRRPPEPVGPHGLDWNSRK